MLKKTALPFQSALMLSALMLRCFSFNLLVLPFTTAHAADFSALTTQEIIHTRTLAASCAACHGTQGNSIGITPVLAGLDPTYFSTQMIAFKNGGRSSTVMHHHAKGLNAEEINQLADYFSQQARTSKAGPKPQVLKENHEQAD